MTLEAGFVEGCTRFQCMKLQVLWVGIIEDQGGWLGMIN